MMKKENKFGHEQIGRGRSGKKQIREQMEGDIPDLSTRQNDFILFKCLKSVGE